MRYAIINRSTCSVLDMNFKDEKQLKEWLDMNKEFKSLGPVEKGLPTRHVRMRRWKDSFDQFHGKKRMYTIEKDHAGWGS